MANLRVHISANDGGWCFQWHQDGALLGGPIEVTAPIAEDELGRLGKGIAQAFEHRNPDGFVLLPSVHSADLAQIGEQLRDLCCGPIAAQLTDGAGPHRLTFVSDVPAALNLPWELLPVGDSGEWLGCHTQWGLFRTPDRAPPPPPVLRGPPLRILFLAAAPTDRMPLDYEKEEEAILGVTATLKGGARLFTAELGSYEELESLLQRVEPHIVHLSGHAAVGHDGVGRFCFEDEAGRTDARDASDLAPLFKDHNVPCVFLNGCQTSRAAVAGLCQALTAAGQPLALGWAASIADERATAFAETFYNELLAGKLVPAAAALARKRIQQKDLRKQTRGRDEEQEITFLLPQLYAACPVEKLFDPHGSVEDFHGIETRYEVLPGGVQGLKEGFVGRRREQQKLVPALRTGEITFLLIHGFGGQGKSTLATRLVNRLGSEFKVQSVLSKWQEGQTAVSCAINAAAKIVQEIRLAAKLLKKPDLATVLEAKKDPTERLSLAADVLRELKCVLVLDNFEDVLELGKDDAWHIADKGLAEFYTRAQEQLTSVEGGRVVVTSRYLPAETRTDLQNVRELEGLNDLKFYDILKLLKRDDKRDNGVAKRISRRELSIALLERLYDKAGGTPRFIEELYPLLRTIPAAELEAALNDKSDLLADALYQYLKNHFGPQLWAKLSAETQCLLRRLSLSKWPLPEEDALAPLTELNGEELKAAVKQGVDFGLLQVFEEAELPTLYLPPGVWRGWLAEQLSGEERTAAHGVLASFWRDVLEKKSEAEHCVMVARLQACRIHAKQASNRELRLWASVQLAGIWERIGEWRAARAVLEEIPEAERDGYVWNKLAVIDLGEGDSAAARYKHGKALAICKQVNCHKGEIDAWVGLATIDLFDEENYPAARDKLDKALAISKQRPLEYPQGQAGALYHLASIDLCDEENYPAARDKFEKALVIFQQIGDRRGEAATWHRLATIHLIEGKYPTAADQFLKAFEICVRNRDLQGEAETWLGLATIHLIEGNYSDARDMGGEALVIYKKIRNPCGEAATFDHLGVVAAIGYDHPLPAAKLLGLAFLIHRDIGTGSTQSRRAFHRLCSFLGLTEPQISALLNKIVQTYQQDRGWSLVKEAFPDWTGPSD